ncbi:hypothetical protein [Pseudonocardia sp. ICBG1293]|uniref:hypothetical protein n=1 Tax=Pseudonocardia sp. ICBG1293 TaxID=2844382 RepID=UPI001CCFBE22|nr:hypothetical protein [Pseudonocardia sp. ICBG1293]
MPRLTVPLLVALALLAATSVPGGPGETTIPTSGASCISEPLRSEHAVTGTVSSTSTDGRIAQVRTDDGREVQVVGSSSPQPNAATTVDRSFTNGAHYEFPPLGSTSPYEDDIGTATHEVAALPGTPPEPPATTVPAGAFVTALVALGIVALAGTAAAFLAPSRRRRNHRRRRRA